jgi:redox-sensitive bicupin YhaK (pirin superfamily)
VGICRTSSTNRFNIAARGNVKVNGKALEAGDGAAICKESRLQITGGDGPSEVSLFDLA